MLVQALILVSSLTFATSTLLINYAAPSPISEFGSCQLEGSYLGDKIPCPGNDNVYIKPGTDPKGQAALHYHRDPEFRRAEVKGAGTYAADRTYFVGYEFTLANYHEHLAIFQWYDHTSEDQIRRSYQMLISVQEKRRRRCLRQPRHSFQPPMDRNTPYSPLPWLHTSRHRRQVRAPLDRLVRFHTQYYAQHRPGLGHKFRGE